MNNHSRARQFIPFQALKGFNKLIKEKEKLKVKISDLKKLTDEEIDLKLKQIKPLDLCSIYFKNYNKINFKTGIISKINYDEKYLICINQKILFHKIIQIEIHNFSERNE